MNTNMNYIDTNEMVLYKDSKGVINSLGYEINSVLPYLNMPAMRGGNKLPGKKTQRKLAIPAGLALLNEAIVNKEKQKDIFHSYKLKEEVEMLPESIEKYFFENDDSNTKRRTRKYKRKKTRTTRKKK